MMMSTIMLVTLCDIMSVRMYMRVFMMIVSMQMNRRFFCDNFPENIYAENDEHQRDTKLHSGCNFFRDLKIKRYHDEADDKK